ncbi:nephrin-like [Homarus americanus]|uniref:nephrin-like n=1 Tax=Homarus americanus TaxID=6706 RepID=UPI001C4425FF|nr:nephrin-like [Homarus americanus]
MAMPAREVWALAGDDALLPCDLSVRDPKDSVQMVMWLREGTHTPLFSVDYRERTGDDPQTWRDNSASTAQRAHMHVNGVDLGLINSIDFAEQSYGGRVTDFGYGESMSTSHLSGSLSSRVFGNRIEDIDSQESATLDSPLEEENIGLVVKDVELNDTAVYRCRVDFLLSPTRNSRVNFTVVVPPLHVGVRWWMGDRGDSVINNEAGPFREGDSPTLICFTRDAWPPPRVVWFEEDVLVDDTYTMDPTNEAVENTLLLKHLTRTHHHRRFTCVAANSNLTKPIAATVHIQMALDVLNVEMDEVGVLSAGVQAEVKCTVWGSSPPPIVTWTLAGSELASAKPWVSDDGNRSVSMVSFTPQPRHDGTQLECSAHNPVITSTPAHRHPNPDNHHSSVLTVNYAPRVSVTLGRSLDAANIKEGDDLYFECAATAKPPPHKVTWSHNGGHLESSPGILVSNMTLVLQKVARSNASTALATPPTPRDLLLLRLSTSTSNTPQCAPRTR